MILVQLSDFTGQYQVARSNNIDPVLQSYIDREEKKTIYKVLGKELGDLIIAYIAANRLPNTPRYNNILDPFYLKNTTFGNYFYGRQVDNLNPSFYESAGLKDLLINTIYYYYVTETSSMKSVQSGLANPEVDTATGASAANIFRFAEQKWNASGYDTWLAIWWRCYVFENSTYTEYLGTIPKVRYGSFF